MQHPDIFSELYERPETLAEVTTHMIAAFKIVNERLAKIEKRLGDLTVCIDDLYKKDKA